MTKGETRAESIERLQKQAMRKVHAGLKARGINIPEIEGASEDDAPLRNLQEWQAIASAFESDEKSAQAEKVSPDTFGASASDSKKAK
jgi:hypothetical protein